MVGADCEECTSRGSTTSVTGVFIARFSILSGGDLPTQVGLTAEHINSRNFRSPVKFHFELWRDVLVVGENKADSVIVAILGALIGEQAIGVQKTSKS